MAHDGIPYTYNHTKGRTMWKDMILFLNDAADMTFREIGERVGLSTSAVHDIASGRTKEPGYDACNKIKRLHGIKSRKINGEAA